MKILLVGNYPLDEQQSMLRYTALLAGELRHAGHDVTVVAPRPVLGRLGGGSATLRKWLGYLDKFIFFPQRLRHRAAAADLVHICDHSNAMYVHVVRRKPHVITCHDLLAIRSALGHFPQNRVSGTGRLLQRFTARALAQAKRIVCISANTCADLHTYLHIPEERLRVVPLSLNWPFRPSSTAEQQACFAQLGVPRGHPCFLHVGANHWYKNRFAVLPIFRELRKQERYANALLVMAGQPWPPDFHAYVAKHQLERAVFEIHEPTNEQLQALYTGAEALIYPSIYEGFGWPILEAQACGCPVATVDQPPMNAVAGPAAIFFDPADPARAAAAIGDGLRRANTLRAGGFRNLDKYTARAMVEAYLATYGELVGEKALTCA